MIFSYHAVPTEEEMFFISRPLPGAFFRFSEKDIFYEIILNLIHDFPDWRFACQKLLQQTNRMS